MATDGMGMCIRLMNPNRQSSDETRFHAFSAEEDANYERRIRSAL
jgi:hypothetical protein